MCAVWLTHVKNTYGKTKTKKLWVKWSKAKTSEQPNTHLCHCSPTQNRQSRFSVLFVVLICGTVRYTHQSQKCDYAYAFTSCTKITTIRPPCSHDRARCIWQQPCISLCRQPVLRSTLYIHYRLTREVRNWGLAKCCVYACAHLRNAVSIFITPSM